MSEAKQKQHIEGEFAIASWDEKTWEGEAWNTVGGAKSTHALVRKTFHGNHLTGESELHYLMCYCADGTTHFNGMERITGTLDGREGTFTLLHKGADEDGVVRATYTVVPGSGTGKLANLCGEGNMELAGHAERYPFTLNYWFED